jgi:hypothetical protein
VVVRRLTNPVTICDGHGVFFVAASGQIPMAADMGERRATARPSLEEDDKPRELRVSPWAASSFLLKKDL